MSENGTTEGLEHALGATRYITAIAGAGIAFLLGGGALDGRLTYGHKWAATIVVISLAISVLSGLAVLARGAVMFGEHKYSQNDKFIRIPGLLNYLGFVVGFVTLGALVLDRIWQ